jgi:hypothetical protein
MDEKFIENLPELDSGVDAKLTELFEKAGTSEQVQEYTRIGVRSLALGADELKNVVGELPALLGGEPAKETPPDNKPNPGQVIDLELKKDGTPDLSSIDANAKPIIEMLLKKNAENEQLATDAMAKAAQFESEKEAEIFANKAKEYENLPIQNLRDVLREVAKKAPDVYKDLEAGLTSTSKLMAKSKAYEQLGKEYGTDSPQGKVDDIVKQAMAKSGGKVKKTDLIREAYKSTGAYEDEIETRRGRA